MKKTFLSAVVCAMVCMTANASDGGLYWTETETFSNHVVFNYDDAPKATAQVVQAAPRRVVTGRPCPSYAGDPVRVKTHTEVIDHYQLYQPVVVYQPAGEVAEYRVVNTPAPCTRCMH